ncbi:MAG: arginine decarboxylase, pyruvoyl-dependent [Bacillota bacterium]
MLPTPTRYTLVAGSGEGRTALNSFDQALLNSGIGNMNLLRVSSILPPAAVHVEEFRMRPGSLLPTAYGAITSEVPGERIAAGVAVGRSPGDFGVIMEFSGKCSRAEAEAELEAMVREAFSMRGLDLAEYRVKAVEHVVKSKGCAFAAAALWY